MHGKKKEGSQEGWICAEFASPLQISYFSLFWNERMTTNISYFSLFIFFSYGRHGPCQSAMMVQRQSTLSARYTQLLDSFFGVVAHKVAASLIYGNSFCLPLFSSLFCSLLSRLIDYV